MDFPGNFARYFIYGIFNLQNVSLQYVYQQSGFFFCRAFFPPAFLCENFLPAFLLAPNAVFIWLSCSFGCVLFNNRLIFLDYSRREKSEPKIKQQAEGFPEAFPEVKMNQRAAESKQYFLVKWLRIVVAKLHTNALRHTEIH